MQMSHRLTDLPRLMLVSLGVLVALPAGAATFTVTRTDDPVPDACTAVDCSLREAVLAANAAPGIDTVRLPAGRYVLEQRGIDENEGLTGDIDITDHLLIVGEGREVSTIDSRSVDYVFEVASAVSLTVRRLGIVNVSLDLPVEQRAGGGIRAGYFGDGDPWATHLELDDVLLDASTNLFESIFMRGSIRADRSTFRNAVRSTPPTGLAMRVQGPSTHISNSEFINNFNALSAFSGEGAGDIPGHIRVTDTRFDTGGPGGYCSALSISGNAALLQRVSVTGFSATTGAVVCSTFGKLVIRDSVFYGNGSPAISVGHLRFPSYVDIYNSTIDASLLQGSTTDASPLQVDINGVLRLSNSTVTVSAGAYALLVNGRTEIVNSVIKGACSISSVVAFQALGANFEGPGNTCLPQGGSAFTNLTDAQLGLGPLTQNGGPTLTRLPAPESVLYEYSSGAGAYCERTDQRGFIRPRPCTAGAADPRAVDDALFIDGLEF